MCTDGSDDDVEELRNSLPSDDDDEWQERRSHTRQSAVYSE
jgi:hypothetical protein